MILEWSPVNTPALSDLASDHAPRLHALVPCAGSGSRAGTASPKQYQPLAGLPLVQHTLLALGAVRRLSTVLVAVAPGDRTLDGMAGLRDVPGLVRAECGGPTRAATVTAGLLALRAQGAADTDWVLVHDAARCLVTAELVDRLIDACLPDPVGGLLAQPVADTLKRALDGRAEVTVPRDHLWQAQTPQMFRLGPLLQALETAGDAVTDEASAMEAAGYRPRLVPSSALNFKVTWPEDFRLAEAVLSQRQEPSS